MQHLMAGMEDRGCRIFYKNFFHCKQCTGSDHGGYWDPEEGVRAPWMHRAGISCSFPLIITLTLRSTPIQKVVICENNLEQKEMVRDTMLHEGVHAFDDCRANVDWS